MKKNLQLILSLLCILALALGISAAAAEDTEARVITVMWKDGDNYDQIRPDKVEASFTAGEVTKTVTLKEANGWTDVVEVPVGEPAGKEWNITVPEGYGAAQDAGYTTVVTLHHAVPATISKTGSVDWDDDHNAKGIRPDYVQLVLYADGQPYGEPKPVKSATVWDKLPEYKPNSDTKIVYEVKPLAVPDGYSCEDSGMTVKFTLNTVDISVTATLAGYPEGTDLSGLRLQVDGPDPSMPKTLSWADVANGYKFEKVLPGAYLVRDLNADSLVEEGYYAMDPENSKVCDAVYVKAGETGTLNWKYTWKEPEAIEDMEEDYDPEANKGNLTFKILGPDDRMPKTITYADFDAEGKYDKLTDLQPGVYTVVELNAEKLVKYYTLTGSSVTGMTLEVKANGTATAKLFNQYVPAPTPEPDAEFIDVPVTKTWNDSNDKDGNRPDSVTVRLYADGVEVDSHVLTAAEGWKFTFVERPRYKEDKKTEIVYSVNEDDVPMYIKQINGYNLVNNYLPEETSRTVAKAWDDNNDEQKIRPTSIVMTLVRKEGNTETKVAAVVLNKGNNWTATVSGLPTVVNGNQAVYAWKEQEVLGYTLESAKEQGGTMTFTNRAWKRPENPPKGGTPKTRGTTVTTLEDYDTPLGIDVMINHVGDCFD